ncbi:alpha/beta hydrolase [Alphaproteobacteria bacterium]|nr:alpha/beta hydrolase [Alphaproteobacteria bacterium]
MKILIGLLVAILIICVALVLKTLTGATPRDSVGQRHILVRGEVPLVYFTLAGNGAGNGSGATIVMIPSLGRSASDFNELALAMNQLGHFVILVEPRGMRAKGGLDDKSITLFDLADDVAAIAAQENTSSHVVLGHAFGNRVARAYATKFPAATSGVVLLAAGGKVPISDTIRQALRRSFWTWMPDVWRQPFLRLAFFANGNDIPGYWMRGWNIPTSTMQVRATSNLTSESWWAGGTAPLLLVQGMADTIAPPEHTADLLEAEFGARVHVVRVEKAGHAILPEQPDIVNQAVGDFLKRLNE